MDTIVSRRGALKLGGAAAAAAMVGGGVGRAMGMSHEKSKPAPKGMLAAGWDGEKYVLPDLPYGYDALEPHHSERMLRIHHDRHHAGYVRGLNATLEALAKARSGGDYGRIKGLSRALAFHGSGHVLHTLYWNSMVPDGSKMPKMLKKHVEESFGSAKAMEAQFAAATKGVEASGWGLLVCEPISMKLMVLQAEKHQNLTMWGVEPLLVCDVWEHAYYLQYANRRGEWVDSFLKLANWDFVAKRLEAAMAD